MNELLEIKAFVARIDKSKAPRQADPPIEILERNYFPPTGRPPKPLVTSLLDHELEEYKRQLEDQTRARVIAPITSSGFSVRHAPRLNGNRGEDEPAEEPLKEELDRNVTKGNRVMHANSCKQYPRVPSKSDLERHAHLFGLKSRNKSDPSTMGGW